MKILVFVLASFGLSFSAFASVLECTDLTAELKLAAEVDSNTGDLVPDTLKVTVAGQEHVAQVKQFKNHDDEIFVIASLGASAGAAEVGYIFDVDRDDNSRVPVFEGDVEKYTIATAPGPRAIDKNSEKKMACLIK